jgi:cytochrome b561
MSPHNNRYTSTAKNLHWLMAVLMPGTLALGVYMTDLPFSPEKIQLYSWHKWAGITVFLFALIRLAWRLSYPPPPLPATTPRWQHWASHAAHWALYALMLAIPLSGWLMSSAKGVPTVWFGVIPIPDLLSRDLALGETLHTVHITLNWLFVTLLAAHVGAALKHHWLDRDTVLLRMLPQFKPRQGEPS